MLFHTHRNHRHIHQQQPNLVQDPQAVLPVALSVTRIYRALLAPAVWIRLQIISRVVRNCPLLLIITEIERKVWACYRMPLLYLLEPQDLIIHTTCKSMQIILAHQLSYFECWYHGCCNKKLIKIVMLFPIWFFSFSDLSETFSVPPPPPRTTSLSPNAACGGSACDGSSPSPSGASSVEELPGSL